MNQLLQGSKPKTFYKNILFVALPLIFSSFLGNVLEVVDLTIASLIDIEILKAISVLERFRFVYGAIFIGFTSALGMYLNRLIPKNEESERITNIFNFIRKLLVYLGIFFAVTFIIGLYTLTEHNGPIQIYGYGTAINVFLMCLTGPLYTSLIVTRKTTNLLKVGIIATIFNAGMTWYLAKHLGMGTLGVILPTVLANAGSWLFLLYETRNIYFIKNKAVSSAIDTKKILEYVKHNVTGSLLICISELILVLVALQLGDIGVLYGVFFAFEKLFNAITHAIANSTAISFSEGLATSGQKINFGPYIIIGGINTIIVTTVSAIFLSFYDSFLSLSLFIIPILGVVFFNSIDYFMRKVVLRPGGDVFWSKKLNISLIACGNLFVALAVYTFRANIAGPYILFYLLLLQAIGSAVFVFFRIQSGKWFHEI